MQLILGLPSRSSENPKSLPVLLLTQPVKDVCACIEVQDEALQLLQAQAQVFFVFNFQPTYIDKIL